MSNSVPLIGVRVDELPWLRLLVSLLRHPDPSVPELARQALMYLDDAAGRTPNPYPATADRLG